MEKTLLFSITVHESYDALNDLVDSIFKSYKNSYIILHINSSWNDFNENFVNHINQKVFINKNHRYFVSHHLCGKTGIHISNIEYFNTLNINFDYVVLCASNELYIKPIDIDFISKNEYGSDFLCVSPESEYFTKIPHRDTSFIRSVIGNGLDMFLSKNGIFGGRHEGMFFTKDIACEMIRIYRFIFGEINDLCRCDEEIILHTILYNLVTPTDTESLCHFSSRSIDYDLIFDFYKNKVTDFFDLFTKYDTNVMYKYSIKGIGRHDYEFRNKIKNLIFSNND